MVLLLAFSVEPPPHTIAPALPATVVPPPHEAESALPAARLPLKYLPWKSPVNRLSRIDTVPVVAVTLMAMSLIGLLPPGRVL